MFCFFLGNVIVIADVFWFSDYSYYYNCYNQLANVTVSQNDSEIESVNPATTEWAAASSQELIKRNAETIDAEVNRYICTV